MDKTYTKEQLKELGILFYEDVLPKVRKEVESSRFYGINPSTLDEYEIYSPEYDRFYERSLLLKNIEEEQQGPMNLDMILWYLS